MSRLSLLNPFRIRDAARRVRSVASGGGPKAIRLVGVGQPEGLIVPTARVTVEVVGRDGKVTTFEPDVPVPFPYAWGYRIARQLGVPLISSLDPRKLQGELKIPGR